MIDYSKFLNNSIQEIKPSGIRKFFDIASEMDDVISLSIGEPDFQTPWHIREEGINSLKNGKTWYSPNRGFAQLREEIANYYARRFNISYEGKTQVLVTVGGSEAIDLAFRCLVSEGDEVIIPEPSFVCYEPLTHMAGGKAVIINTKAEDQFRLKADDLEKAITDKTKLVVLPFPNNPTGAIMTKEDYLEIIDLIVERDVIVIADEIYSELTYGKKHFSITSLPGLRERSILINGFSKAFAMTGWRLGYTAAPKEIASAMCKIHQYTMLCAPSISQAAALEAMKYEMENGYPQVNEMLSQYNRRRKLICSSFNEMGLNCFNAEGAFYVFPNISSSGLTSEEFCERLLFEKDVACVPGTAFGEAGEGYMRCSYASSIENIKEALRRIKEFLEEI